MLFHQALVIQVVQHITLRTLLAELILCAIDYCCWRDITVIQRRIRSVLLLKHNAANRYNMVADSRNSQETLAAWDRDLAQGPSHSCNRHRSFRPHKDLQAASRSQGAARRPASGTFTDRVRLSPRPLCAAPREANEPETSCTIAIARPETAAGPCEAVEATIVEERK